MWKKTLSVKHWVCPVVRYSPFPPPSIPLSPLLQPFFSSSFPPSLVFSIPLHPAPLSSSPLPFFFLVLWIWSGSSCLRGKWFTNEPSLQSQNDLHLFLLVTELRMCFPDVFIQLLFLISLNNMLRKMREGRALCFWEKSIYILMHWFWESFWIYPHFIF